MLLIESAPLTFQEPWINAYDLDMIVWISIVVNTGSTRLHTYFEAFYCAHKADGV